MGMTQLSSDGRLPNSNWVVRALASITNPAIQVTPFGGYTAVRKAVFLNPNPTGTNSTLHIQMKDGGGVLHDVATLTDGQGAVFEANPGSTFDLSQFYYLGTAGTLIYQP